MSLARVRSDADWRNGPNIDATDFKALDDKSVLMVDGDGGGTFDFGGADTTIAGKGMGVGYATARVSGFSGGSGTATTPAASGRRFVLGDGDVPLLGAGHAGATRSIKTPGSLIRNTSKGLGRWTIDNSTGIVQAVSGVGAGFQLQPSDGTVWTSGATYPGLSIVVPTAAHANGCVFMSTASTGVSGGGEPAWTSTPGSTVTDNTVTWVNLGQITPAKGMLPLRVHDGATFASVFFTFKCGRTHVGLPAQLPKLRVLSQDKTTGKLTPLSSSSSVVDGFYSPTPANAAAYYNGGVFYTNNYVCDAGIIVDRSRYNYLAEIWDEGGANAWSGNEYHQLYAYFTGIADCRPS